MHLGRSEGAPARRLRHSKIAWSAFAVLALVLTACGDARVQAANVASIPQRPVLHEASPATDGVQASAGGFTFDSSMAVLPPDHNYQFRILGPDGTPQTHFLFDQTKLLHFIGIRDDLTDFVHVHPIMAPDGTWSINVPFQEPGPHYLYVDFLIADAQNLPHHLVLRQTIMVPGPYILAQTVPAPSLSASADGYTITFEKAPKAWTVMLIPAKVTFHGQPAKDLQPYLAVYAHFTAISEVTHLYGHAHPLEYTGAGYNELGPGWDGGPNLTFHAEFPGAGLYRAFVEFQTNGVLHTAALTLQVS